MVNQSKSKLIKGWSHIGFFCHMHPWIKIEQYSVCWSTLINLQLTLINPKCLQCWSQPHVPFSELWGRGLIKRKQWKQILSTLGRWNNSSTVEKRTYIDQRNPARFCIGIPFILITLFSLCCGSIHFFIFMRKICNCNRFIEKFNYINSKTYTHLLVSIRWLDLRICQVTSMCYI